VRHAAWRQLIFSHASDEPNSFDRMAKATDHLAQK